jgi:hypothetical protein
LVVPSNAKHGQDSLVLTAGGTHFDVRFSVAAPPPPECVAAGYKAPSGTSPLVFLWLLALVGHRPGGLAGTEPAGTQTARAVARHKCRVSLPGSAPAGAPSRPWP